MGGNENGDRPCSTEWVIFTETDNLMYLKRKINTSVYIMSAKWMNCSYHRILYLHDYEKPNKPFIDAFVLADVLGFLCDKSELLTGRDSLGSFDSKTE